MKIKEKKDKDFLKSFLEIDGFLYRVFDEPSEYCAARLIATDSKPGLWHFYRVIGMNGNDLSLTYDNRKIKISYSAFREQNRAFFVKKVKITPDGLSMPREKLPDTPNDLEIVFDWLFSLYESETIF